MSDVQDKNAELFTPEEEVTMAINQLRRQSESGRPGPEGPSQLWPREFWDNYCQRVVAGLEDKRLRPELIQQVQEEIDTLTAQKEERNEFRTPEELGLRQRSIAG
jgi:hypothetical protein